MLYSYFYILFHFLHFCTGKFKSAYCRDDSNNPVEWWYMYKLPFDEEYGDSSGKHYTYITSDAPTSWQMSPNSITRSSMLYNTLAPLFRSDVTSNVAYAVLGDKASSRRFPGSSLKGLFLADTEGGFFMGHSIPDFPDVNRRKVHFPTSELSQSHIIFCMSLNAETMSEMINTIRLAKPSVVAMNVPQHMVTVVPAFAFGNLPEAKYKMSPVPYNFQTSNGLLRGTLLVRRPGDIGCIYASYARQKLIYLDVYSPDNKPKKTFCSSNFGVRSIESISVKTRDLSSSFVQYVKNSSDVVRIAMSTAAHWQKKGLIPKPYMACIGSLDREDITGRAGMLFCVNNFQIWYSFDNFKVKEPSC